jgi:hypothetical protein
MLLSVRDRLVLINILPKEGDFRTLKTLRELREALSFTDSEQKSLNFVSKDGMINWDEPEKDKPMRRDIPISGGIQTLIVETLQALDAKKALTEESFALYEMFVEDDTGKE